MPWPLAILVWAVGLVVYMAFGAFVIGMLSRVMSNLFANFRRPDMAKPGDVAVHMVFSFFWPFVLLVGLLFLFGYLLLFRVVSFVIHLTVGDA